MILQINAVELAAELAKDKINSIYSDQDTINKIVEEGSNIYGDFCDYYMKMITNAQNTTLFISNDGYYPLAYIHKKDLVKLGFEEPTEEQMALIASDMQDIVPQHYLNEDLSDIASEVVQLKYKEDAEED